MKETHSKVKYKLIQPGPAKKYGLYTWYNLTKEYIFERSVETEEEAKKAIDQLLKDGFIKVTEDET